MDNNTKNFPAYLALAAGIFIIGTSVIWVRFANLPGLVSGFYRVSIASLVLLPMWAVQNKGIKLPVWDKLKFILLGGVLFGADLGVWNSSIMLTSVAKSVLLANNAPIWVGLGAALLFKEKLTKKYWLGMSIALVGMALIVGIGSLGETPLNLGDALAIGVSFIYAGVMLSTQKARAHVNTLTFTAIYTATAALALLPVALLTGQQMVGFSAKTWWSLIGLALGPQVIGWLFINYAMGYLRASHVSVSLLGQPIISAILGVVILGEIMTTNQVIGAGLALTGIYLVNQKNANKRKPA